MMARLSKVAMALVCPGLVFGAQAARAEERFVPCMHLNRTHQCVTVPLAASAEDAAGKAFLAPADGLSRIYVVRPYTAQPKQKVTLLVDGIEVSQLAPRTYAILDVPPGTHQITVQARERTEIVVAVEPGTQQFVQYQLRLQWNTVRGELTVLPKSDAHKKVRASSRTRVIPGQYVGRP